MIQLFRKENLIISLVALSFSSLLMVILLSPNNLWYKLFIFLNVPAGGLDLADAKSIVSYAEIFLAKGFVEDSAVDFWNRKFVSISFIWKNIAILFKFYNPINFYIFIYISFFIYIFAFLKIAYINKNKFNFLFLFFFFTTSSFYLIERGNFDLILFGLVTLLCFIKEKKYQLAIVILLAFLKINLIYLFFILIKNIKTFLVFFFLAIIILLINYKYVMTGYTEIGNSASIIHYGIFTIIKSVFSLLNKIIFFDVNEFSNLVGITILIIMLSIFYFFFLNDVKKIKLKNINLEFSLIQKLFLVGSFFYIFSFIFFSAPDYKLVFLVLTLPYLFEKKYFFITLLIFLIMNSCIFETYPLFQNIFYGEPRVYAEKYTTKYLVSGLIIHSLKILIFILLFKKSINLYRMKVTIF